MTQAQISAGSTAPSGANAPSTIIGSTLEAGLPVTGAQGVYARAFGTGTTARVVVLPYAAPSSAPSSPTYIAPATITRSAVVITLPANTATQLASSGLKSFFAQAQGSNPVVIGYDNTVCTGTGATLAAANGATPGQSIAEYPASNTPYFGCSVAGSSVAVIRGQ